MADANNFTTQHKFVRSLVAVPGPGAGDHVEPCFL